MLKKLLVSNKLAALDIPGDAGEDSVVVEVGQLLLVDISRTENAPEKSVLASTNNPGSDFPVAGVSPATSNHVMNSPLISPGTSRAQIAGAALDGVKDGDGLLPEDGRGLVLVRLLTTEDTLGRHQGWSP